MKINRYLTPAGAALAFALLFIGAASAAPVKRLYQDAKLPTQQLVEKQSFTNPVVAGTADVLSAHAGNTSAAAASASTFVAQPDVSRNLVVTPGGTTADVAACVITISGTNFFGVSISDTFTFVNNQTQGVSGLKAFKTVTLVSFPANCEDGGFAATWSVGFGEALGMKRCMDSPGHVLSSTVTSGGTQKFESTRPTVGEGGTTDVSRNTADFNGTMNGANDFELFFYQNFLCFP